MLVTAPSLLAVLMVAELTVIMATGEQREASTASAAVGKKWWQSALRALVVLVLVAGINSSRWLRGLVTVRSAVVGKKGGLMASSALLLDRVVAVEWWKVLEAGAHITLMAVLRIASSVD